MNSLLRIFYAVLLGSNNKLRPFNGRPSDPLASSPIQVILKRNKEK